MLGNIARMLVLASAISGLCASALANTTASSAVNAVTDETMVAPAQWPTFPQLAQSDLSLPILTPPELGGTPFVGVVTSPLLESPPVKIALLLPTRSTSLARVSDAVRAGFMAAYQKDPGNVSVHLVETGDAPKDVLAGYRDAVAANDLVVGPLTRSGATAIVQDRAVSKPTILLTQLNNTDSTGIVTPSNMLVMGLSIEDEARQVADWAAQSGAAKSAFVISTSASWQMRAARAFAIEWRHVGQTAELMQINMEGGYLDANALLQLRTRLQTDRPQLIFVALDAVQAIQLRAAIGKEMPMYGTSQLNPLTMNEWATATPLTDMEGVRLVDMPWQLQVDHAAVMAYPQYLQISGENRSPDVERLYALGIDAYRVARNIALQKDDFQLDGVTGKLTVRFGHGPSYFDRVAQPAVYVNGVVQPLQAP
tara:strand:- start:24032 stop:25306 length:1275 start_codon:yes stop_codon:yes gene_type:complete